MLGRPSKLFIASLSLLAAMPCSVSAQQPILTEFLARNDSGVRDEDGDRSDWIEVHNPSSSTINLGGWRLTDESNDLTKWAFPPETLAPGEYLVVFASNKDRTTAGQPLHTNFRLASGGEFLALVSPAAQIITQFAPQYPAQSADVSYGYEGDLVTVAFFDPPTPGAPNGSGGAPPLEPVTFSRTPGFESGSAPLGLQHPSPGATIRYTLDGREPSGQDLIYAAPLLLTETTTLRARAFEAGSLPSPVSSGTWIFQDLVEDQSLTTALGRGLPSEWVDQTGLNWNLGGSRPGAWYGLDDLVTAPYTPEQVQESLDALPSLSLQMHPDDLFGFMSPSGLLGIYANSSEEGAAWERPCSLEWLDPNTGLEFQIDCGVNIQGGANTDVLQRSQLSMALKFKSAFGPPKLEHKVFEDSPLESFDYLILDCSSQLSINAPAGFATKIHAQETRDEFAADTHEDMQHLSPHGRWVHLYLNGLYWGVLHLHERPDERFAAAYGGGGPDEYDWVRVGEVAAGNDSPVGSAAPGLWQEIQSIVAAGVAPGQQWNGVEAYEALAARVDLENYADYLLMNWYVGNTDWPQNNWMATAHARNSASFSDVDPDGRFVFHNWDAETVLFWGNAATAVNDGFWDRTGVQSSNPTNAAFIHSAAIAHPDYLDLLASRVQLHMFTPGGALWVEPGFDVAGTVFDPAFPERNVPAARYFRVAIELGPAVLMEYARWGNYFEVPGRYNLTDWVAERDRLLNHYFPIRGQVVLQQLLAATPKLFPSLPMPSASRAPGRYRAGVDLTLSSSATIYYTLDGSDPRESLGAVNQDAIATTGPVVLPRGTSRLRARAFDGAEWSPLFSGTYCAGARVRINEAQTDNNRTITDAAGELEDWFELRNLTDTPLDLGGFHLTDDPNDPTKFEIPAGVTIPARGYLLFWADEDSSQGPTHVNFRLSANGEFIGLHGPEELSGLTFDSTLIPPLRPDHSFARTTNGRGGFSPTANPTPGFQNLPGQLPPR